MWICVYMHIYCCMDNWCHFLFNTWATTFPSWIPCVSTTHYSFPILKRVFNRYWMVICILESWNNKEIQTTKFWPFVIWRGNKTVQKLLILWLCYLYKQYMLLWFHFDILYSRKSVSQVGNILTLPLSPSPVWHISASQKYLLLGKVTIADTVFMWTEWLDYWRGLKGSVAELQAR